MYLGLDFGTSSVKAVLIDGEQKILASASIALTLSRPRPGWSEQNPQHWWKAAHAVVIALRAKKPKAMAAVAGIGLSGQQHGAVMLDGRDKVLRPAILWNDARAFAECDDIVRAMPHALEASGNMPLAGFTAPKLLWVEKHEREVFKQVAKVLLPKDYIRLRMTGVYASDMSDASGTYWLNVQRRAWDDELLAVGHMREDQMPELFEGTSATGRLLPAIAKAWGMGSGPNLPIVAGGGGDNAASACGIGAVADDAAFLSLGTSGVLFASNTAYKPNTARAVHSFCHAVPKTWHQMGVILSATASLEWLAQLFGCEGQALTSQLGKTLKAPSQTQFLPYLSGERTPVGDARIRGAFTGLSHDVDRTTLTQTVLEGVSFAFRDNLEALKQAGTQVKRLIAVGGGSRSEYWLQLLATVLDVPLELPVAGELGGAFGAARLGMIAATGKNYKTICTGPKIARVVKPVSALTEAFGQAYHRYTQVYPALQPLTRP